MLPPSLVLPFTMSAPALPARYAVPIPAPSFRPAGRGDVPPESRAVPEPEGEPVATVLIAEDHEDSRDALRTLLEAFGYRVLVAGNGREAVEQAIAERPDLILMDVMMPEMDGLQATRVLRAAAGFAQVPIIAVTAMEGARQQVAEAGFDELVAKPLDVRLFLDRVRVWTGSGRAAS